MQDHVASSLHDFHKFVGEQLQLGAGAKMSPEEALQIWRERQATLAAVREGLADIEAGRTKPLQQFLSEFQSRHGYAER